MLSSLTDATFSSDVSSAGDIGSWAATGLKRRNAAPITGILGISIVSVSFACESAGTSSGVAVGITTGVGVASGIDVGVGVTLGVEIGIGVGVDVGVGSSAGTGANGGISGIRNGPVSSGISSTSFLISSGLIPGISTPLNPLISPPDPTIIICDSSKLASCSPVRVL